MFRIHCALIVSALLAASATAQVSITTTVAASGLSSPVFATAPPGDTARLFIVEQGSSNVGRIKVLDLATGVVSPTVYLSVTPIAAGGEQGLLGLAFHPDFANNGYFFVDYTNSAGNTVVARYRANAPYMTSTTADVSSAMQVITIAQPFSNHNGGWVGFGPDHYLYVAMGDGGSGNDPNNNGQTITNMLLGKMLRLDVDGDDFPTDAARNYAIPPTNPFVGITGDDEIYHYGLRNPWRDSFDRLTGQMYIGDVGQGAIEEVDVVPPGQGGLNFGWRCMEGNSCTGLTGCTCNSPTLTYPIQSYTHANGCAITGGYVYRGSALCGWQGRYFYADYCSAQIWWVQYQGVPNPPITNVTAQLHPPGGLTISSITSFGEDANGELYICDASGKVFKIVPNGSTADCNLNGIPDACDIQSGTSLDQNGNGIPDECDYSVATFCPGDGTGAPCPCGNSGTGGNGCANSVISTGAGLTFTGIPSVSADTFSLEGGGMPNDSALYFQGTTQVNGGLGVAFGDGLRCAGGTITRLGVRTNTLNGSTYPGGVGPSISVRGGITSGPTTRTYQVWYRNAAPGFCTPSTSNLSNGLSVVWVN
jgi:glucose/arabinose dehydrogenase